MLFKKNRVYFKILPIFFTDISDIGFNCSNKYAREISEKSLE